MTGSVWPQSFEARPIVGRGVVIRLNESGHSDVSAYFVAGPADTGTPLDRLRALRAAVDEAESILLVQGEGERGTS